MVFTSIWYFQLLWYISSEHSINVKQLKQKPEIFWCSELLFECPFNGMVSFKPTTATLVYSNRVFTVTVQIKALGTCQRSFLLYLQGLGRSEQGSTDHIKVNVKNNNHGLGANASHEVSAVKTHKFISESKLAFFISSELTYMVFLLILKFSFAPHMRSILNLKIHKMKTKTECIFFFLDLFAEICNFCRITGLLIKMNLMSFLLSWTTTMVKTTVCWRPLTIVWIILWLYMFENTTGYFTHLLSFYLFWNMFLVYFAWFTHDIA